MKTLPRLGNCSALLDLYLDLDLCLHHRQDICRARDKCDTLGKFDNMNPFPLNFPVLMVENTGVKHKARGPNPARHIILCGP